MSEPLTINKAHSALLVMDYQNDIVTNFAGNDAALVSRAANTLAAARQAGLPVIYVVSQFRQGYPEISPDNQTLGGIRAMGLFLADQPGSQIHAGVAPQSDEVVVVKRRIGAFSTTDLATVLKARKVECVILMGIATSGVVLSTVRWAADSDYEQIVVGDCCADPDPQLHEVLTTKVFPAQATVVASPDLIAALRS